MHRGFVVVCTIDSTDVTRVSGAWAGRLSRSVLTDRLTGTATDPRLAVAGTGETLIIAVVAGLEGRGDP